MASLPYLISLLFIFTASSAEDDNATTFKGATEFDGGLLIYANFVPFINHKLNISAVEDSRMVRDEGECIAACTEKATCRSVNFNANSDVNGEHSCQILDKDKFVAHESFIPSLEFHHFSFMVRSFYAIMVFFLVFFNLTRVYKVGSCEAVSVLNIGNFRVYKGKINFSYYFIVYLHGKRAEFYEDDIDQTKCYFPFCLVKIKG